MNFITRLSLVSALAFALSLSARADECPSLLLPPTFTTMRIAARQFRRGDTEPLRRIVRAIDSAELSESFDTQELIDRRNRLGERILLYVLRQNRLSGSGRVVGAVKLTLVDPSKRPGLAIPPSDKPWLELGYFIAPAAWNRGYASEAVLRVLHLAGARLEPAGVLASADKNNVASQRILIKNGFRIVGHVNSSSVFVRSPVIGDELPPEPLGQD